MLARWLSVMAGSILIGLLIEYGDPLKRDHDPPQAQEEQDVMPVNRLADEKSPYLLQHAHNPVDWYPWGAEAFEKARREDKPIFLSIGYSTCHWCHVMEHESFENEEIARVMNENFVSIKVDREERPDVDQIYMNAVQGMTGSGGWPLSVFLTHDLEPFWGGTYFPPESRWGRPGFKDILLEVVRLWKEDREKIVKSAQEVGAALKAMGRGAPEGKMLSEETLRRAYAAFEGLYDPREGGFGGAPKFPRSETISLMLRIHRRTGEKRALSMAQLTLEKMARGGIYDQLGGGFHRYSTDAQWLVPHFEKMLYDNALLARAYLEAFQVDGNAMWEGVARETLDYVLRDMTSPEGGFYSAEDADSEGEEGKFYLWTEEELKTSLTAAEFAEVKDAFQVTAGGNFEGKTILTFKTDMAWKVRYQTPLKEAMRKLLKIRSGRIHPHKDDKILASWNGLMIGSMAYAAQVLDDPRYLAAAQKAADFVLRTLWDGRSASGGLKRRYREGDVRFDGSLDDYAFVIAGLLDLYESDFDPRWFGAALDLQRRSDALFWDEREGGYFFTGNGDSTLISRSKDIYDGAVPSGNSVAALNLLRLYGFTLEKSFRDKAEGIVRNFSNFVSSHPQASPSFLMAVDYATDASKEIAVVGGEEVKGVVHSLQRLFLPNKVLASADLQRIADSAGTVPLLKGKKPSDGRTTIYLCEDHACRKPAVDLEEILPAVKAVKEYKLY